MSERSAPSESSSRSASGETDSKRPSASSRPRRSSASMRSRSAWPSRSPPPRAAEALAPLALEAFELAQAVELLEQLPELGARVLVLERVVAQPLDLLGERLGVAVPARQELVQARRLEAVGFAQRALLAVEDLVEARASSSVARSRW